VGKNISFVKDALMMYIYVCICIYMYIYMYIYGCVCVWREREININLITIVTIVSEKNRMHCFLPHLIFHKEKYIIRNSAVHCNFYAFFLNKNKNYSELNYNFTGLSLWLCNAMSHETKKF